MGDLQLSLRLTDGALAALDQLVARVPGYSRHALALWALEVGARELAQHPARLLELEQERLRARLRPLLDSVLGAVPADPNQALAGRATPPPAQPEKSLSTPAAAPSPSGAKAPKKCEQCGKNLLGLNGRARFCGDTCKKRWHRAQGKA